MRGGCSPVGFVKYVFVERRADLLFPMQRTADHPIIAQDGQLVGRFASAVMFVGCLR